MSSIIFFLIFIPILSIILLSVNFIFAPHNPYKEKKTPFECGYHSFLSQNRTQFTISFFIFALLFLIFDLEIVLIYPFTVSSYANNIYGLVIMIIFTLIVTVGFIFELGKNALKIESKQSQVIDSKTNKNLKSLESGFNFPFFNLFLYFYYIIGSIKIRFYNTFVVVLLLGPGKGIFSFLAFELSVPSLVFFLAAFLIVINILLRSGLENKPAVISLKTICIPLFIIFFLWLMHYLNLLGRDSALYASCLTALPDWEEIASKMDNFSFPSVNHGEMAVAGKAGSQEVKLEKSISRLIPTSLLMEEEGSGSRKRPNPDTDSGIAGPSKKVKVTISPPCWDNCNVPAELYSATGKSIMDRFPEGKIYRGSREFEVKQDEKGYEYIPCPRDGGIYEIGSSGFISYKSDRSIDKATIIDSDNIFLRGWCSDGTRSNQPTASRTADVLLTAKVNGQKQISNSTMDTPLVKKFLRDAAGNKSDTISYRLITALRISK